MQEGLFQALIQYTSQERLRVHRITVVEDFISQEDADILINEIKFGYPKEKESYPAYYSDRYGGTAFPYNDTVTQLMRKYGHKANEVHKEYNGFVNPIYVFKYFGNSNPIGWEGELHADSVDPEPWIEFSTVIYLNDEFTGGKIYFPNQDFEYSPKKLSAVFFPSAGTEYVHGVTKVLSGSRYTIPIMHTSLPYHADPDLIDERFSTEWQAKLKKVIS
jgi:hypothetical protein